MAALLARIGRFAYVKRVWVLLAWLIALIGLGFGAAALSQPTNETFTIPGTEAQRAIDLLEQRMPEAGAGNATARVVFTAQGSTPLTDPEATAAIEAAIAEISQQPNVAMAMSPFALQAVSPDGATAMANVMYRVTQMEVTEADRDMLVESVQTVESAGIGVEVGGSAVVQHEEPGGLSEGIGLLVAAVVLAVTFGALIAAGMPLLTAVIGVAFSLIGIEIATGFLDIPSTTSTLATMLGLAVGIDYALFIVSRYRHELLTHRDGTFAIGMAVGTAGSAVVFAGLTVTIALVALVVVGIPFLSYMGIAAAAAVLIAVAIAITLLPALLGFAGEKILGRRGFAAHDTEGDDDANPAGQRWATFVTRRRWIVAIGAIALLAVMTIPAADLRLGLPSEGTLAESNSARRAYDQVAAAFGPGVNGALLVAIDLAGADDPATAVGTVAADLGSIPGARMGAPPQTSAGGDLAIVTVIPATGPDDAATEDLVREIRSRAANWEAGTGAAVSVTGETAVAIDVSKTLADALVPYLAIIVGLAFLLLTLVFRSLLVPLKATLGFLLSVGAAFGVVVAVFQWGWLGGLIGLDGTVPIVSFLPIILIGLLFGLAMDYEVFLVTRMREEFVHGASADKAIHDGLRHGARVVTAAALIMVGVFSGFVLADDVTVKAIGFSLAIGVLLDAFVVRMTIVPAVMSLLGKHAWSLPKWIDRIMPDVDIEGTSLERGLPPASSDADTTDPGPHHRDTDPVTVG